MSPSQGLGGVSITPSRTNSQPDAWRPAGSSSLAFFLFCCNVRKNKSHIDFNCISQINRRKNEKVT